MKKILSGLFLFLAFMSYGQKDTAHITVFEGTEVKLKTLIELKGSELKVGDKIDFELAEPIIITIKLSLNLVQEQVVL